MYNTGDSENIFLQIKIIISITSLIYPGNRKTTESKLKEKANGYKTTGNTRWECIEIDDNDNDDDKDDHDDLEEKENKSNNVNKNRKTKQQNSRLAQKTPKKEAKTPRKTPQKGRDKMKLGADLACAF